MSTLIENPNKTGEMSRPPGVEGLFIESLVNIRKGSIYEMPNFSGQLNHDGEPTRFDTRIGQGLYLDPEYLPVIDERGVPDRISFNQQPMLKTGREDSQHGVFFGTLSMSWFAGNGHGEQYQVAVKPAHSDKLAPIQAYQSSLQELALQQYFGEINVPTFEPLGLLVIAGGPDVPETYRITRFEPITSMDNINWSALSPENQWQRVGAALSALAFLHSKLIFHGDPAFKNLSFGQTEGEFLITDIEDGRSLQDLDKIDKERGSQRIGRLMSKDLRSFVDSADEFVLPSLPIGEKPSPEDRFEIHLEHVYIPYFERLTRNQSPYLSYLTNELNEIIERKLQEASGTK